MRFLVGPQKLSCPKNPSFVSSPISRGIRRLETRHPLPAPAILEWVIRSNDRRNQLTLREGERRRGYSVGKYRSVRDTRHQDRSETQGEDRV